MRFKRLVVFAFVLSLAGCWNGVSGERFNPVSECWSGHKSFTIYGFGGCDTGSAIAEDDEGVYWRFSSSCIPDGMTPVSAFPEYPECPRFGTEWVMARRVTDEDVCLETPFVFDEVESIHPCWNEPPGLWLDSEGSLIHLENGCNLHDGWVLQAPERLDEFAALPFCDSESDQDMGTD